MHAKFIALLLLSVLPWSYIGFVLLTDQFGNLAGFGYLPFFGLLFAKELALKSPGERTEAAQGTISVRRLSVVLVISVLLVAVVLVGANLLARWTEVHGDWIAWLLAGTFVLVVIWSDVSRAAARSLGDQRRESIAGAA